MYLTGKPYWRGRRSTVVPLIKIASFATKGNNIINIDITISKTDMIIFEINIVYVSNLAHAWTEGEG